MPEIISSLANPLIKQVRAMRQKKARDESDLFLVEGILHVGEAEEAGWEFEALLYCQEKLSSPFGLDLVRRLSEKGVRCNPVSAQAFESFAEKDNPQGLAALVRQQHHKLSEINKFDFFVAIVSPQDPGNVGTILRTIDAVDADGLILLDGGVDPYHPTVVRASMGTLFWKPFFSTQFLEFSNWVIKENIRLIGTSAHATLDYKKMKLDDRSTILLLGSEQKGLQPEQLEACSELISLPMRGKATSLNLAVSAGVFLYSLKG